MRTPSGSSSFRSWPVAKVYTDVVIQTTNGKLTDSTACPWIMWNDGYTTTASTDIWQNWNVECSGSAITTGGLTEWETVLDPVVRSEFPVPSAEEVAAKEARYAKRQKRELEAKTRAEALLEETLSEDQRDELKRERYFTVESKTSKRRYRVRAGMGCHGNIEEVDEQGRALSNICCAPRGSMPEADALVGQKLWLEYDDEAFLRVANVEIRRAG